MGITKQDCEILYYSKYILGVSFSKVLTLGKLIKYVKYEEIRQLIFDFDPSNIDKLHKIKFDIEYSEPIFELLGANRIDSLDFSDYEEATIIHDLNIPIHEKYHDAFSTVVDGGTIEHIFNFPTAIHNCMNALEVGGHYIGITPGNNQMGHGFYQFSPELYFRVFSSENGFKVLKILVRVSDELYEVSDPKEVNSRIELVNHLPTTLIVIAEKKEKKTKFVIPQQSDYINAWAIVESIKSNRKRSEDNKLLHLYRRVVPRKIKVIVRNIYDIIYKEKLDNKELGIINPQHFKKIEILPTLNKEHL